MVRGCPQRVPRRVPATWSAPSRGSCPDDIDAPLAALELEKAAYEVLYELNNRPDWLPIPLAALESS